MTSKMMRRWRVRLNRPMSHNLQPQMRSTDPIAAQTHVIRQWPSEEARKWTERFLERMCSHPEVLAVVAFGSAVRRVSSSADLDLLYIYRSKDPRVDSPPLDVDVRGYDQAAVEELIEAGHDLLCWTLKYGRVICECEGFWTDLRRRWLRRLPMPSAELAEERAARSRKLYEDLHAAGDADAAAEQWLSWLTHKARAALIRAGVFPASRPELPEQLRAIGESSVADALDAALTARQSGSPVG